MLFPPILTANEIEIQATRNDGRELGPGSARIFVPGVDFLKARD